MSQNWVSASTLKSASPLKKPKNFAGLALGGGKTDKTCLAFVDYYPERHKVFLVHLWTKIKTQALQSADEQVVHHLQCGKKWEGIGIDTPLKLPKCLRCRLKCPGYEECNEPEIIWLWKQYDKRNKKKRPHRLFTPYTERCAEFYISHQLEEEFHPPHALGSNMAPLTARALFLQRRLKLPLIEVYPKLSLWRIGCSLGIAQSHLRYHKHSVGGEESREVIIEKLIKNEIVFIYNQDAKTMIEIPSAFDAFICAMTAFLKFRKQTEFRPKGFPSNEAWIEFPLKKLDWK